MAVLIEAISVVIRLETIVAKYRGGVEQYVRDCPNSTLCMDKDIVRVGFMTTSDAIDFVKGLEKDGFRCVTDGEYDEIAIVDQFEGFFRPCDWLEFTNSAGGKNIERISACKIKGAPIDYISKPEGWNYETSISKRAMYVDADEFAARTTFLQRKGNVYFYLDKLTGEEVCFQRTIKRNLNS